MPSGVINLRKLGVTLFTGKFFSLANLILSRHRIRLEELAQDEI